MPPSPRWLSYRQAAGGDDRYLRLAERWGVSEVARRRDGFMGVYRRHPRAARMKEVPFTPTQTWGRRRDVFVARHYAQYKRNPTPARALALRMWTFDTGDGALEGAAAER